MAPASDPQQQETMTMPFKRRVSKERDPVITPAMIAIFDKMRYAGGQRYDDLHVELWDAYQAELSVRARGTKPWEWPLCIDPRDDTNPHPKGSAAWLAWQPNERAREMWKALDQARREARAVR